jgi:hypothetical protein
VLAWITRVGQHALVGGQVQPPPDGHRLCLPRVGGADDHRWTVVEAPEDGTPFTESRHEQPGHERHREVDFQRLREQVTRTGDERDLGSPTEVGRAEPVVVDHDGEGVGAQRRDLQRVGGDRQHVYGQHSACRRRERKRDPYRFGGVVVRGSGSRDFDGAAAVGAIEHEFHRGLASSGRHLANQLQRELRQVRGDRGAEPGVGAGQHHAVGHKIITRGQCVAVRRATTRDIRWAL